MNYVISDIHNNARRFKELVGILKERDRDFHLYVLGDFFDRSEDDPQPLELYYAILWLGDRCTLLMGDHEKMLAEYIRDYYAGKKLPPYRYNSFDILRKRLTRVDLLELSDKLLALDRQIVLDIGGEEFLLAHAMTSAPGDVRDDHYYLYGENREDFLENGIEGHLCLCGHFNPGGQRIWKNGRGNVYVLDCGCAFENGRLGCLCLETREEIYIR